MRRKRGSFKRGKRSFGKKVRRYIFDRGGIRL